MLQGALYAQHRFWFSSSTKAISNASVIAVVLLLKPSTGIHSLAFGYLGGFMAQCAVLWFALNRAGHRFRFVFDVRDRHLKDTAKLVIYPMAGQSLGEARTLIENFFASFYAPGILSALRYASRIIYALSGVLMSGVVTATAPSVAEHAARKDTNAMKGAVRDGAQLLLLLSLPVCTWLVFAGSPLISLLFERGSFTEADVALTASLMALMSPYVLFSRAISITQTPFYAARDTRTILIGTVSSFVLYAICVFPLTHFLGCFGFPIATCSATGLCTLMMCLLLRRSFGSFEWVRLRTFVVRLLCAVGFMAVAMALGRTMELHPNGADALHKMLALGVPSVIGAGAFLVAAFALKILHFQEVFGRFAFPRWKLLP